MTKDGHKANELLQRAYSVKNVAETKELYRDWATTYDETMLDGLGYVTPQKTAAMLAEHLADRGAEILDIGCGTGLAGVGLAKSGYQTIDGLDYSAEMLEVARKTGAYRDLFEADLNAGLDLPDAKWDALICTGTFTHSHVGADCLDELLRILRPGGLFATTIHGEVFAPAGFKDKTVALEADGVMETIYRAPGTFYANSTKPEGEYFVWRKR